MSFKIRQFFGEIHQLYWAFFFFLVEFNICYSSLSNSDTCLSEKKRVRRVTQNFVSIALITLEHTKTQHVTILFRCMYYCFTFINNGLFIERWPHPRKSILQFAYYHLGWFEYYCRLTVDRSYRLFLVETNEFVCLRFYDDSRIFHSYGDVTIADEWLQILTYTRHLWPLSSEGS